MKHLFKLFILTLFIFISGILFAQTNNCNDNNGGEITVNTSCQPTTMNSNNNTDYWDGAGGCGAQDRDDVWAWFDATSTTTTITYQPVSNRNAILTVFTSNCNPNMNAIACANNGGNGVAETLSGTTTIGTRYRIRVQRSGSNGGMNGTICVYSPPSAPTCTDGIQNGDETGIDCGGTICAPCAVPAENCADANPFCSDLVYNFPTTTNSGTAEAGPDYTCLNTQPNPVWYFLQVNANGSMTIEIVSSCGDVDFTAWGPFPAVTCDTSDLTAGNTVDCSYSNADIEYLNIPNGIINDYYVVLITNYDNCNGFLSFNQTSGGGSSNCSVVLPISLLSFEGYPMDNYNLLKWTTTTEINNDYFVIQKSYDAQSFTDIGIVNGNGNSVINNNYEFIDETQSIQTSYYRLKQVDFNGEYSYSKTIEIKFYDKLKTIIYPNPSKGKLFIDIDQEFDANYTVLYTSILGNTITEEINVTQGYNTYELNQFNALNAGIYFIQILSKEGDLIKLEKIVKE